MTKKNSQKFIGQNRAPRVQIEYDVELYGADKRVELPFVMAVMADLSGQPEEPLPPVAERKFLEISVDNFDERLAALKPRVALNVPNTITGEGNLPVEMRFEKLSDFSPASVARKVEPLRRLLEVRARLANLLTYMDGKVDAEQLVSELLMGQKEKGLAAGNSRALASDTNAQRESLEGDAQ
jgi:type VI secretion system protein ImpB